MIETRCRTSDRTPNTIESDGMERQGVIRFKSWFTKRPPIKSGVCARVAPRRGVGRQREREPRRSLSSALPGLLVVLLYREKSWEGRMTVARPQEPAYEGGCCGNRPATKEGVERVDEP